MQTPHPPATAEFGHVKRGDAPLAYPTVKEGNGSLAVQKITTGDYDNNVYLIRSGNEAMIVDGAAEPERILAMAAGATVAGIVQTHGHFDHVQALASLVQTLRCPVYAHPDDDMPVATQPLRDGQAIRVGDVTVSVMHTPGHTPGSTCFVAGNFLFSGDTLFPGGPGNTEGDPARFAHVMEHLERRLFALPDDVRVCPGHGLDTFIGRERQYLPVWRERGW